MTRQKQLTFISICCLVAFFFYACRKSEYNSATLNRTDLTEKFFNLPANTPEQVRRISTELQRQNRLTGFISRFAAQEGMVRWEKAQVQIQTPKYQSATAFNGEETPATDTTVLIPLVQQDSLFVNGFLAARLYANSDSITLRYYIKNGYQFFPYESSGASGATAEAFAAQLMQMDNTVFGYTTFALEDNRLFIPDTLQPYTSTLPREIMIEPTGTPNSFGMSEGTICFRIKDSIRISGFAANSSDFDIEPVAWVPWHCVPVFEWGDGPFGPTGTGNPGGNGGGNGGGYYPGGNGSGSGGPGGGTNPGGNGNLPPCSANGVQLVNGYYLPCGHSGLEPYIPFHPPTFDYADYAVPPFTWSFTNDDGTTFTDTDPLEEPDFQFDPADNYETKYPRFSDMVKNLKTFVKNNTKVLNALQTYSGFSKQQILDHLTFGQGPTIKVEEMTGRFGYYNKNNGNNTLHIRGSYVRGLEQAYLQSTQEATAFLLAVTILHEFIHLGTTHNNISEGQYDFGLGFERDAFNVIVDDDNAGTVVIKFSKYF